MRFGVGLPSMVVDVAGATVVSWAEAAERAGFSAVATVDRIAWQTYDPLDVLAAASSVTSRVDLITSVLLAPLRQTALLGKRAASIDSLSGGRLRLGLAVGSRSDDYEVAGAAASFHQRGKLFDEQLYELRRIWNVERIPGGSAIVPGDMSTTGPPILLGGSKPAAARRVAEHGAGWISGGGGAAAFSTQRERIERAWSEAGRAGTPALSALVFYGLGPRAAESIEQHLSRYYSYAPFMRQLIDNTPTNPKQLKELVAQYSDAGCDELLLFPCAADLSQLELLAEAVL